MRASSLRWVIDAADFQRAGGPWASGFDLVSVCGWLCLRDGQDFREIQLFTLIVDFALHFEGGETVALELVKPFGEIGPVKGCSLARFVSVSACVVIVVLYFLCSK